MEKVAKKVIFRGSVQGVGFRFTAMNIANKYELSGEVRNRPDGTVEMVVQGDKEDVSDCLRDINESFEGYIREMEEKDIAYSSEYGGFEISF